MHQQLRVSVARSGTSEGPGAVHHAAAERDPLEVRQGTLARLLERVAEGGFDLRIAGGSSIEGPGELILAVDDDGDQMDRLHDMLAAEYEVRRVDVQFRELTDEPGAADAVCGPTSTCAMGVCMTSPTTGCPSDRADCDADPSRSCEANLRTSAVPNTPVAPCTKTRIGTSSRSSGRA